MKRTTMLTCLLAAMSAPCLAPRAARAETGLIPPPAISIPYGGKIVTEINLSDNDVLGIIKQVIPAIGEVVGSFAAMAPVKGPVRPEVIAEGLKSLNFKDLADAISGITNVRVLVVKYGIKLETPTLLKQLDAGVAKLGDFSRVLSDVGMMPGVMALYAQAEKGGYVGYAYDARGRVLYAGRVVGSADVEKLTKWITDAIKLAAAAGTRVEHKGEEETPPAETAPEVPEKG